MIFQTGAMARHTGAAFLTLACAAGPVLASGDGSKPYVIPMGGGEGAKTGPIVIPMAGSDSQNAETAGTLCTGEDWVVFSGVSTRTGKVVSICMKEGDDTTPSRLTYRFGALGNVEMRYPDHAEGSFDAFTLRRYTRPRTTYLKFEFSTGGYLYAILDGSDADAAQTEPPVLRVTRVSDGVVVARHDIVPKTEPLALMQLERIVRSAPFDE